MIGKMLNNKNKESNIIKRYKDKNILLVCTETYSWPMHYISQELKTICSSINCLFIQPGEAYFKNPEYLYFCQLNKHCKICGMEEVVEEYLLKYRHPEKYIDDEYIDSIQKRYTTHASLNTQFHSEMTLISYMHDRDYYRPLKQNLLLLYAQIYYKWMENLFESNRFDMILDCDTASFGRAVLLELSTVKKIPYINLDDGRVNNYNLPTLNLGKSVSETLLQTFEDARDNPEKLTEFDLKNVLNNIINDKRKPPKRYEKNIKESRFGLAKLSKRFIYSNIIFLKYLTFKRIRFNFIQKIDSPICGNILLIYKDLYKFYFRKIYMKYFDVFERPDLKSINYILVPLHVIPEASTIVLAPYNINEIYIIESLAKSVAPKQYIVVKEHWGMIGERSIEFYKRLKKIPNVILIDPEMHNSSYEYIINCDLVVTIAGTTALEAALMGKNSILFSDTLFSTLSGVKRVYGVENLSDVIESQIKYNMPEQELLAYLFMIRRWGEILDINALMVKPEKDSLSVLRQDIHKLLQIYVKGLDVYKRENVIQNMESNYDVC
jgi:hypothetical protein